MIVSPQPVQMIPGKALLFLGLPLFLVGAGRPDLKPLESKVQLYHINHGSNHTRAVSEETDQAGTVPVWRCGNGLGGGEPIRLMWQPRMTAGCHRGAARFFFSFCLDRTAAVPQPITSPAPM